MLGYFSPPVDFDRPEPRTTPEHTPRPTPKFGDPLQVAATLLQSKGGTFDLTGNPVSFPEGYQVGGYGPGTLEDPATLNEAREWVVEVFDFVDNEGDPEGYFLGSWTDDNGRVHLDVSRRIFRLDIALEVASILNEKAIWDWSFGTIIEVLKDDSRLTEPSESGC